MRILALISVMALLVSCSAQTKKIPAKQPPVALPPIVVEETNHKGINFVPTGKMTNAQKEMIVRAAAKANEVIQSQCFVDWMGKQKVMNSTNGRTKQQVIDHIRSLNGEITVKMYYAKWGSCLGCTSAVAFRQPPRREINLNSSFFTSKTSLCRWAATMCHESLHAAGNYGHTMKWTRFREDTIPYLCSGRKPRYGGDVFSFCCKE